jgi:hypothetical protein
LKAAELSVVSNYLPTVVGLTRSESRSLKRRYSGRTATNIFLTNFLGLVSHSRVKEGARPHAIIDSQAVYFGSGETEFVTTA